MTAPIAPGAGVPLPSPNHEPKETTKTASFEDVLAKVDSNNGPTGSAASVMRREMVPGFRGNPLVKGAKGLAVNAPTTPGNRLARVDRSKVDPELLKGAQAMEAMYLDYLMKIMRQTVPKSEFDQNSQATEIYQGMLDGEYADRAAAQGGVGLADQIIAYMQPTPYTQERGAGTDSNPSAHGSGLNKAKLGGTNEGKSTGN